MSEKDDKHDDEIIFNGEVKLDTAAQRIDAVEAAGKEYTEDLEAIRNNLDNEDGSGSQLGLMERAQLEKVEAATRYDVPETNEIEMSKIDRAKPADEDDDADWDESPAMEADVEDADDDDEEEEEHA